MEAIRIDAVQKAEAEADAEAGNQAAKQARVYRKAALTLVYNSVCV